MKPSRANRSALISLALLSMASSPVLAAKSAGETQGAPLDHVFLIMMENETDTDILENANAPFINAYAKLANRATNYFGVGHPSAPNYLALVGGSNFGLTSDFSPKWPRLGCVDNAGGSACANAFAPISVAGQESPIVATAKSARDCNGRVKLDGTPVEHNCALYDYPATTFAPQSIADQLVAQGKSWKSYQESLPMSADVFGVNYADGARSNLSPPEVFAPGEIQQLYAVKHNPFAYFLKIELGDNPALSLDRVKDFDGPDGLWADLQRPDKAPNFAFIVPNQCHDMHGFVRGGAPICSSKTDAEKALLMREGDAAVAKLVSGIKASPVWSQGRNAIVLTWDENDYDNVANRIILLVETNYAPNGRRVETAYDHYSLLRTLEEGFGLPCLNHACDKTSSVMAEMFGLDAR